MDFSDIINDLKKLEGMQLNSIRPGAEITIASVDLEQKKVQVRSASGKIQSRPFFEFQRIWEALLSSPAIRVEEVLNGSGSSRNQPETIFANLPYIQWLKLDNKKHIAYVGKSTHSFGTLQQMDSMQVAQLSLAEKSSGVANKTITLVVSDSVSKTAKSITSIVGKDGKAETEGLYVYDLADQIIVLADEIGIGLPCGTYAELRLVAPYDATHTCNILGNTWRVVLDDDFKAIILNNS